MIFTNEQIEAMKIYRKEFEQLDEQIHSLFNDTGFRMNYIVTYHQKMKMTTTTIDPCNEMQDKIIHSLEYKQLIEQKENLYQLMKPTIEMCKQSLQDNFHELIDDIKNYDENIFIFDRNLYRSVYQRVRPLSLALKNDVVKSTEVYYLCEFYIKYDFAIKEVIEADSICSGNHLLNVMVDLFGEDPYIKSIIIKHIEKTKKQKINGFHFY